MTMFSAENRQFCGGYGGVYGEGFDVMSQLQGYGFSSGVGSDLDVGMAEEELRTDSLHEGAEPSSTDAPDDEKDEGWLQLSIGGHGHHVKQDVTSDQTSRKNNASSLVELELMPSSSNSSSHLQIRQLNLEPEFRAPRPVTNFVSPTGFSPSLLLQHPGSSSSTSHPHQEINWAFRTIPINIASAAVSSSSLSSSSASFSSSSSLMASGHYFPRPFQLYAGVDMAAQGRGVDFRVIQPPRRPHSGIWFMLQASQNQEKEPFLPQISKSYLRIKDGRMTIQLVKKYLVNKLSLENESEIEIRCKGQRLLPFLTLQHVRDNIWSSPKDFITLLPNSSTTNHIMVLQYARTTSSN